MNRSVFSRLNFWLLGLLLFCFVSLIYIAVGKYDLRWDFTKDRVYTLSPKTVEVLKSLGKEPVTVRAFFKNDQPGKEEIREFLTVYAHDCPALKYEFVDPDRNPGEAKRYGVDEYGTVIVERGKKRERFKEISEEAFTNALLKLGQSKSRTVCFTEGHGEKLITSDKEKGYKNFTTRLESENYTIKHLLLSRDPIPAETDLLVIAGPVTDFLPEEMDAVKQYADNGGKLLVLLDPLEVRFDHLEDWLNTYGVSLGASVVVDKLSRVFGADYLIPIVTQYGRHPITEKFTAASFLPIARTVTGDRDIPKGFHITELAFTSPGSWAEKDWKQVNEGKVSLDEGEAQGPLSLAVAIEKEQSPFRLVVFGDSDFADNAHFYLSGNTDLALNTVAWLSGDEKLVTIRPKERASTPLMLTDRQQKLIFAIPIFALPILSIGSGLGVFLFRKKYA